VRADLTHHLVTVAADPLRYSRIRWLPGRGLWKHASCNQCSRSSRTNQAPKGPGSPLRSQESCRLFPWIPSSTGQETRLASTGSGLGVEEPGRLAGFSGAGVPGGAPGETDRSGPAAWCLSSRIPKRTSWRKTSRKRPRSQLRARLLRRFHVGRTRRRPAMMPDRVLPATHGRGARRMELRTGCSASHVLSSWPSTRRRARISSTSRSCVRAT